MMRLSREIEKELDRRLTNWAYWVIPILKNEIGFPAKSVIADIDFGSLANYVRVSKPPIPLNNFQADEMNCWINLMGKVKPEFKQAIKEFYLSKHTIVKISKTLEISTRTFNDRLHGARTFLKGCIISRYHTETEIDKNKIACNTPHTSGIKNILCQKAI